MTAPDPNGNSQSEDGRRNFIVESAAVSVASLTGLFILVSLFQGAIPRLVSFLVLAAALILYFYVRLGSSASQADDKPDEERIFTEEIEEKLLSLEEAGEFFGASLRSADVFRLLESRISEIVPIESLRFYSSHEGELVLVHPGPSGTGGAVAAPESETKFASKAISSGEVLLENVRGERQGSLAALPLLRGKREIGVLILGSPKERFGKREKVLFEAIGERIVSLVAGSLALGTSVSTAMTDALTGLPNERALRMMLDKEVSESQRFPEERPLSVASLSIDGYREVIKGYGHSTGDALLVHAAGVIRDHLRGMDTVARFQDDEFFMVLPRTSVELADSICDRLAERLAGEPFAIEGHRELHIAVSTGSAVLGRDGDTSSALLRASRIRRDRESGHTDNSVIFFPTGEPN